MIRVREARFWTALVVIALSAIAIGQGVTAVRLAFAQLSSGPALAAAKVTPFAANDLVGDIAGREAQRLTSPSDPSERAGMIGQLLSQTPLNSGAWLDLAKARRAAGASTESVAAALALSTTTGPNEQRLMAGRAVFGLPFWGGVPPDARRSLIGDLVGGWDAIDGDTRAQLADTLRNAPGGTIQEVRAGLLLNGGDGAKIAAALVPPAKADREDRKPAEFGAPTRRSD